MTENQYIFIGCKVLSPQQQIPMRKHTGFFFFCNGCKLACKAGAGKEKDRVSEANKRIGCYASPKRISVANPV